jgi:hypothetical protein
MESARLELGLFAAGFMVVPKFSRRTSWKEVVPETDSRAEARTSSGAASLRADPGFSSMEGWAVLD